MGRSQTIHCIGIAEIEMGKHRLYYAMNGLEVEQQRVQAKRDGLKISEWEAQTRTGERILRMQEDDFSLGYITDEKVGTVCKTVPCPICMQNGCPVCNYSGITKRGRWKRWQKWQLEDIRKRLEEVKKYGG